MADETVIIAVDGDASGWRSEIKSVETTGEAAARKIQKSFDKAAKQTGAEFKDLKGALGAVFGGVVNDAEDVATAIGALGPIAGGAALAFAGAAGLTGALYAAASASGELDQEQRRLSESMADLTDAVGQYVAPAFESILTKAAHLTDNLRFAVVGFEAIHQAVIIASDAITNDMMGAFDLLSTSLQGQYDAVRALATGGWDALGGQLLANRQAMIATLAAHGQTPDVLERSRAKIEETWAEVDKLSHSLHLTTAEQNALTAAQKEAARAAAFAAAAQGEFNREVDYALDDSILAGIEAQSKLETEAATRKIKLVDDFRHARYEAHKAQMDDLRDEQEAEDELAATRRRLLTDYATASIDIAAQVASAMASSAEEGSAAQKRATMAAYALQQGGAVAQAAINAVTLGSELAVALAPALGPLAIPAAVALAAAQGAAAAAAILAVPAPQVAHVGAVVGQPGPLASSAGNAPDEVSMRLRRGEEVVPRGGRRSAEPDRPIVIQYNHRLYDAADADRSRMSRNPYRLLALSSGTPGHRR